jgi:hypothetical protein
MLRRTARKAFRQPGGEQVSRAPIVQVPAHLQGRQAALDLLFSELRGALELAVGPVEPDEASGALLSVPRARPSGVEFFLCGHHSTLRFRHTMEGWIRVDSAPFRMPTLDPLNLEEASREVLEKVEAENRWEPLDLVAVHPRAGGYRPLRRPAVGRRPFQYITPSEMAQDYLRRV